MIHWAWLIVAMMVGGAIGLFAMGIVAMGARADLETELILTKEELAKCQSKNSN